MTVEIRPAVAERFGDAEHALSGGGDGAACHCQWWMLSNADFGSTTREQRTDLLRTQLGAVPSPALIAYVDAEPAGWVRVGPRIAQARIRRTRAVTQNSVEPADDPAVWAVSCFVVRREHRGAGLSSLLLTAAVAHARANGARVVEGYPVVTTGPGAAASKKSANQLFHGVLSTFERAGFDVIARPASGRALVSLTL